MRRLSGTPDTRAKSSLSSSMRLLRSTRSRIWPSTARCSSSESVVAPRAFAACKILVASDCAWTAAAVSWFRNSFDGMAERLSWQGRIAPLSGCLCRCQPRLRGLAPSRSSRCVPAAAPRIRKGPPRRGWGRTRDGSTPLDERVDQTAIATPVRNRTPIGNDTEALLRRPGVGAVHAVRAGRGSLPYRPVRTCPVRTRRASRGFDDLLATKLRAPRSNRTWRSSPRSRARPRSACRASSGSGGLSSRNTPCVPAPAGQAA